MILKKVYDGETGPLITGISYMMVFILKLNFEISLGLGLGKKVLYNSTRPKMLPAGLLKSGPPRSVAICEHLLLQL